MALFISLFILGEIEGVLLRTFRWSPAEAKHAFSTIRRYALSVSPRERVQVIREDESDNRILERAKEADAHVIVAGDRHLQNLRVFDRVVILSSREPAERILS